MAIAETGGMAADAAWVALETPPPRGCVSSATRQKRRFDASPLSITTPLARALGFLAPAIALERLAPAGAPFAIAALLYFVVVRGGAVRPGFAGSGRRRRALGANGASGRSGGRAVGGASAVGSASAVSGAFAG